MSDKIILSPGEYKLYQVIADAPLRSMSYVELNEIGEFSRSYIWVLVEKLVEAGVATKTGKRTGKTSSMTVHLKEISEKVISGEKPKQNCKPESDLYIDKRRKRGCLNCRKEFVSDWPGERVCKICKGTPAWKAGDGEAR